MLERAKWQELIAMQKVLDNRILSVRGINNQTSTLTQRFLALLVEIAEFANEHRCFKYWSNKAPSPKQILLEEYVDAFHFIISICNDLHFDLTKYQFNLISIQDINSAFLALFMATSKLYENKTIDLCYALLDIYFTIGHHSGFTGDDIFISYLAKNNINHQRQSENY